MSFRKILYVLVQKKQVEIYHAPPKLRKSINRTCPLKVSPKTIHNTRKHTLTHLSYRRSKRHSSTYWHSKFMTSPGERTKKERFSFLLFTLPHSSPLRIQTHKKNELQKERERIYYLGSKNKLNAY